jgi:hypothetical protein
VFLWSVGLPVGQTGSIPTFGTEADNSESLRTLTKVRRDLGDGQG